MEQPCLRQWEHEREKFHIVVDQKEQEDQHWVKVLAKAPTDRRGPVQFHGGSSAIDPQSMRFASITVVSDKTVKNIRYIDKEIINLKKDLIRSRLLIQCVKIGRGYFTILREENARKKRERQLQMLKEEELNKFQPAKTFSDIQCRGILMT
ncbi:hypothetical protein STEG23_015948, partial [Scotinomys teguina]